MSLLKISVLIFVAYLQAINCEQRVVCYWPEWTVYLKDPYKTVPEEVNATLCTHIHFAFAILGDDNETLKDGDGAPEADLYKRLEALKKVNPTLKVILSLGGGGEKSEKYSTLVASAQKRKNFLNHTLAYLKQYGFDGLDLDWEFPTIWGGRPEDKANYAIWIKELKTEFDKHSPPLSLSAAVEGGDSDDSISFKSYDFAALGTYLDYICVMTYDNAGSWSGVTGLHSGLDYSETSVKYFASKGVPKSKLLIGVPFYGVRFILKDATKHSIGAAISDESEDKEVAYWEICDFVKNHNYTKEQTKNGRDPIAYHNTTWFSYDDPNQAYLKAKFSKDNGYGGVIVWEITQDDVHKKCCAVDYPMLRAINYGLYDKGANPSTYKCE